MRQHERIAPGGPTLLAELRGLDPFGQFGRSRQCLFNQPGDLGLGQSLGQAVDRLTQPLERLAAFLDHMVGMDDLEHVAEPFQLARYPARFADWQLFLRRIGSAAEIGQREDIAHAVLRQHAIGRAWGPTAAMLDDGQPDHDLLALARLVDILHRPTRHETFGQVVVEIAHPG